MNMTRWIGVFLTLALLGGVGCNDAQTLYDAASLGKQAFVEPQYEGTRTLLGVDNVACLGPGHYGITFEETSWGQSATYIAGFVTDEAGTIIARTYAAELVKASPLPFMVEFTREFDIRLQFAPQAGTLTAADARAVLAGYFDVFGITSMEYRYIQSDDFWQYLLADGSIRMEYQGTDALPAEASEARSKAWAWARAGNTRGGDGPPSGGMAFYDVQTFTQHRVRTPINAGQE